MLTRRGFDVVLLMMLGGNLAFGLPRHWGRKEVAKQGGGLRKLIGAGVLHATS